MLIQILSFLNFLDNLINIYFWPSWVFLAARALLGCGEWGLLTSVASPAVEQGLQGADLQQLWLRPESPGSAVVAHGPCCSTACGIFPDQGLDLRLPHWPAGSLPLSRQGSRLSFIPLFELHLQGLSSQLISHVTKSFATPWVVAHQASLSMGFPRQECWGCRPLLQEVFLTQGSNHISHVSCIAGGFLTTEPPGKFIKYSHLKTPITLFHLLLPLFFSAQIFTVVTVFHRTDFLM